MFNVAWLQPATFCLLCLKALHSAASIFGYREAASQMVSTQSKDKEKPHLSKTRTNLDIFLNNLVSLSENTFCFSLMEKITLFPPTVSACLFVKIVFCSLCQGWLCGIKDTTSGGNSREEQAHFFGPHQSTALHWIHKGQRAWQGRKIEHNMADWSSV